MHGILNNGKETKVVLVMPHLGDKQGDNEGVKEDDGADVCRTSSSEHRIGWWVGGLWGGWSGQQGCQGSGMKLMSA